MLFRSSAFICVCTARRPVATSQALVSVFFLLREGVGVGWVGGEVL